MKMRKKEARQRFNEIRKCLLKGTKDTKQVADTLGCSYLTAQKWLERAVEKGIVTVTLKRRGHILKSEYTLSDPKKTRKETEGKI